MDPQLIPYGWGLFSEKEEVILVEQEDEEAKKVLIDSMVVPTNMDNMGKMTAPPNHLIRIVTEGAEVVEHSLLQPLEVRWQDGGVSAKNQIKQTSQKYSLHLTVVP